MVIFIILWATTNHPLIKAKVGAMRMMFWLKHIRFMHKTEKSEIPLYACMDVIERCVEAKSLINFKDNKPL